MFTTQRLDEHDSGEHGCANKCLFETCVLEHRTPLIPLLSSTTPTCGQLDILLLSNLCSNRCHFQFFTCLPTPVNMWQRPRAAWDYDDDVAAEGDPHPDDIGDDEVTPEIAGQEFADMLFDLKVKGRLSARDVCVLSFYASLAGLVGPACDFGFRPSAPTGHFQRHLDTIVGTNTKVEGAYMLTVPAYDKYGLSRTTIDIETIPMHEALNSEVENNPDVQARLVASIAANEWTDHYTQHVVKRTAPEGEVVFPIALYLDGVPFQKKDGLLAFYAYNLISETRHLLCVIRKSQICVCGCLGWCTLRPIWVFLHWGLCALASGQMPAAGPDGAPFGENDGARRQAIGAPIVRCALLHVKGDWGEFSHSMGLPTWQSVFNPCFVCKVSQDRMKNVGAFGVLDPPYVEKQQLDYESACQRCERVVNIDSQRLHAIVLGSLFGDKRSGGGRGRCLNRAVEELGLLPGDRLEPSHLLGNVGLFESLPIPSQVLFWRPANMTVATHRNPIFSDVTGVTIKHLALDILHCLNLGVYKDFCTAAIWAFILGDVWQTRGRTQEELIRLGVSRCKNELFKWYARRKQTHRFTALYELQDLRPSMLGTPNDQSLATKGAETGTLLYFCTDMLRIHAGTLGDRGAALLELGISLVVVKDTMRGCGRVLDVPAYQTIVDNAKRAFVLRENAVVHWAPKWHMLLHLVGGALIYGNPVYYTTFLDEDYNGRLATLASKLHRSTWYARIIGSFRIAFSVRRVRRRSV